jgi:hypothetical protein
VRNLIAPRWNSIIKKTGLHTNNQLPCGKCGSKRLYFFDDPLCPTCDKLAIIPTTDALAIINHFINTYRKTFLEEVRDFNKNELLSLVFWEREKIIRQFYTNYTPIDQQGLATCNLLLKRVIRMNDFLETRSISNRNSVVGSQVLDLWLIVLSFSFLSLPSNIIHLCNFVAKRRRTISGLDHNHSSPAA